RIDFSNVDNEIQSLLGNVPTDRLEWKLDSPLTEDFNLDQLKAKYDAVFLGMGLTEGIRLFDDAPQNVVEALDFLREAKSNVNIIVPGQVAVIGGGNTAMDAAVAAQLAGAQDVYLLYRRSFAELPAWPAERDAALNAGIHFLILSQPVEYVANELNDVKAVKIARTKLGEPDESGRRRPEILGGSESVLPVNLVIEAIGQRTPNNMESILNGIELNRKGLVVTAKDSNTTSREGVYAGGDLINGGATAVQAVADGLRAANEINTFLE
ncbi:FAD-dependent oxidoreductase, partial [bacterium]|nr:FAD-dependent oxidoreductase [bacterium]